MELGLVGRCLLTGVFGFALGLLVCSSGRPSRLLQDSAGVTLQDWGGSWGGNEITERTLNIRRVNKVTKGGNVQAFSALMVAGDQAGKLGLGVAKASIVADSVVKAGVKAKADIFDIPLTSDISIPHRVEVQEGAAKVILMPNIKGLGIRSGGVIRPMMETGGVKNIRTKRIGKASYINQARAVMTGLRNLRTKPLIPPKAPTAVAPPAR